MEQKQLGLFGEHNTKKLEGLDPISQKTNFLALSLVRGIGFQTLRKTFERYGRFDTIWSLSDIDLHQFTSRLSKADEYNIAKVIKSNKDSLLQKASDLLQSYKTRNIDIVFIFESGFPQNLSNIPDPPYWLFVEGNRNLLNQDNIIAVVGSRTASFQGINLARKVSAILSKHGYPIVSGLAEGIDAIAHQTSIDYGNNCVAVLGNGISIVFPASTAPLRTKMVRSGGVVITEYLPDDSYSKSRFVQRNRLQAALSRVVIPIEWSVKGGTAHTIQYAEKYKRPVIFLKNTQGNSVESNANLYTSNNNRYFVDALSNNLEDELMNVLHRLQIQGATSIESSGKSTAILQSVIDEFERLIETYEVSNDGFTTMIEELKNRWSKKHTP